ncbi:hypothetical protein M1437_00390 [Patescibacteria group bacterium]|nr:hypothetical protein [Patescibacteria group bacterium]
MQKGTATLILLVVGLVMVGFISLFAFGFPKSLVLPKTSSPVLLKQLTAVSDAKPLIYSNQKLGLEFQYLNKDFKVQEDSEADYNKRGNGDFRKNFKGYVGYEPGKFSGAVVVLDKPNSYEVNPFSVWVFDNPDNLTATGWFDKYWYYPFVWGVFDWTSKGHIALDTEATISGKQAKYKIVSYQPGKPKFVYVQNGQKMYLFKVVGDSGDKILSSLKLTQ